MLCYLRANRACIIDTVFHESEIKNSTKILIKPHNRHSLPKAKEKTGDLSIRYKYISIKIYMRDLRTSDEVLGLKLS